MADIIFWFAVQYSGSPAFTILKLFRAVTEGIVNALAAFMVALLSISIPSPHTNLLKTAHSSPRNNTAQQNQKPSEFLSKGFKHT